MSGKTQEWVFINGGPGDEPVNIIHNCLKRKSLRVSRKRTYILHPNYFYTLRLKNRKIPGQVHDTAYHPHVLFIAGIDGHSRPE
jgi:hypothetical protein